MNFGGIVFAVEPIEWDHWMWCLFLGFGSLLWGQLVTSIPKSIVKKVAEFFKICKCCKRKNANELEKNNPDNDEDKEETELEEDRKYIESSRVAWVRGSTRILQQVFYLF